MHQALFSYVHTDRKRLFKDRTSWSRSVFFLIVFLRTRFYVRKVLKGRVPHVAFSFAPVGRSALYGKFVGNPRSSESSARPLSQVTVSARRQRPRAARAHPKRIACMCGQELWQEGGECALRRNRVLRTAAHIHAPFASGYRATQALHLPYP